MEIKEQPTDPSKCPKDKSGIHCGHWQMGTKCCDCGATFNT